MLCLICLKTVHHRLNSLKFLRACCTRCSGLLGSCRQNPCVGFCPWDGGDHKEERREAALLLGLLRLLIFPDRLVLRDEPPSISVSPFSTKGLMGSPVFDVQNISWPFRGVPLWKRSFLTV